MSRLLQRRACFEATSVAFSQVAIERTKGSKPFMANKPRYAAGALSGGANWNFNVSHEGKYVCIATEPAMVCGVDVAAPEAHRGGKKRGIDENLNMMKGQLTNSEMFTIQSARPDEQRMEDLFRRFWSLKEAFTKARGDGLGFEFSRCDFALGEMVTGSNGQPVQLATVKVDGKPLPQWRFFIQDMSEGHWISVARGPPTDIIDAHGRFKSTFGESLTAAQIVEELDRPEPSWSLKRPVDLIADDMQEKYLKIVS
uniref:holo-[acyl-carrier-protein] synthase n=1 Tax=Haptolina brevifila TaxID=156173 RepID=A0A7S2MRD3_9EUKA